jgi:hypothetical protein
MGMVVGTLRSGKSVADSFAATACRALFSSRPSKSARHNRLAVLQ